MIPTPTEVVRLGWFLRTCVTPCGCWQRRPGSRRFAKGWSESRALQLVRRKPHAVFVHAIHLLASALGIRFTPVSNVVLLAKLGVSKRHSRCSASVVLAWH